MEERGEFQVPQSNIERFIHSRESNLLVLVGLPLDERKIVLDSIRYEIQLTGKIANLITAEQYVETAVSAVRENTIYTWKQNFGQDVDCLIVDSLEELDGREYTLPWFFQIAARMLTQEKKLCVSLSRPPSELASFRGVPEILLARGAVVLGSTLGLTQFRGHIRSVLYGVHNARQQR